MSNGSGLLALVLSPKHFLSDKSKSHSISTKTVPIQKADKRTHADVSTVKPNADPFVGQSTNHVNRARYVAQPAIGNSNAADHVPTGMEFFETLRQKNLYQTITLPPPVNIHAAEFVASPQVPATRGANKRSFVENDPEAMGTMQHVQTEQYVPQPQHNFYRGPSERKRKVQHKPEMFKFTLDDAIQRDDIDYHNLSAVHGPGPVTIAPDNGPLFDARLLESNQPEHPYVSQVYEEVRKMRQSFPSLDELTNENMNLGEQKMSTPEVITHPSTIAAKLTMPHSHGHMERTKRGRTRFTWTPKSSEDQRKFHDNRYSATDERSLHAADNWEPMGGSVASISSVADAASEHPDIEITKEKMIELTPEMLKSNAKQQYEHSMPTAEVPRKREHHANALEVSSAYSEQRAQGNSGEARDIIYGYGKPQHIPFILNHAVGRIPKASITEYKAPSMYVPMRRPKPAERHPDDTAFVQAMRKERPHAAPHSEISKYFQ